VGSEAGTAPLAGDGTVEAGGGLAVAYEEEAHGYQGRSAGG
jgi:hypothetical protein